ncbi:MAG: hypothetical protein A2X94_05580 [Bdellovibrionales bacterium GWB1_55_8]|nr:MAG: hypothetical protein A2X94_05580 [Bdellovibrionales bacterium GWB1_55_8]
MLKWKQNESFKKWIVVGSVLASSGFGLAGSLVPRQAMALDILTAPIQVFTQPCYNYLRYRVANAFCYTQKHNYAFSHDDLHGGFEDMGLLVYLAGLPFMILDEKTNTSVLDSEALKAQGYTESEILAYKSDLELVDRESELRQVNSEEKAIRLLTELKANAQLAQITIEIMGI